MLLVFFISEECDSCLMCMRSSIRFCIGDVVCMWLIING